MMRRLRVTRAHGRTIAPLRDQTIELGDGDFIVVSGPNESGKSSLAEVLSWVLAGRRTDHEAGLRLASFPSSDSNTVDVEAAIEGSVDGKAFDVHRVFKIRRRQQGRPPVENPPVIHIDGSSTTPASWASTIGVETGDDYFRTYRITGPYDSDQLIDIGELLESLAIGVSASTPPRVVLDRLKVQADSLVPPTDGRLNEQRALKAPTDALADGKRRRQDATSNEGLIDTLQSDIDKLDEVREGLDVERRELVLDVSAHEAARDLISSRQDLDAAQAELDSLPNMSASWVDALGRPGHIDVALTRLDAAENAERDAADELERSRVIADLPHDELLALTIDESDVEAMAALDNRRAEARLRIDTDRVERPSAERDLDEAYERFAQRAEQLGCSPDQLRAFAKMSVDDVAFGDPLKAWSDAEASLDERKGALKEAQHRRESDAAARAEVEDRWAKTSVTQVPEAVVRGDSTAPTPSGARLAIGSPSRWKIAVAVVAAFAIVGLSATEWWLGIIGLLVGVAVLAVSSRPRRSAVGGDAAPPPDIVGLAGELIAARSVDAASDAAYAGAADALRQAEENLERRHRQALAVLADYGLPQIDSATRAARLRAERPSIVADDERIAGLQRRISDLGEAATAAEADLVAFDDEAMLVSARIGLAARGARLDAAFGRRLLDAMRARRAHESAAEQLAVRRGEVGELLPDLPTDVVAEVAQAEVASMSQLLQRRSDLESRIMVARQSLDAADERAMAILDAPDVNERLLALRIGEMEQAVTDVGIRLDELLQERGALRSQREEATARSDLTAINQDLEQAAAQQRDIATEGAAWWVAHRLVADVKDEVEANQQPELVRRASELARRITDGYWHSISTDDEGGLLVRQGSDSIGQKSLSAGARDVLRLVIRLAVAEAHSARKGVALPIILDDPTASVDDMRAPRLFDVLAEFSDRHQVILMTHDARTIAQAVAVGAVEVAIGAPPRGLGHN